MLESYQLVLKLEKKSHYSLPKRWTMMKLLILRNIEREAETY